MENVVEIKLCELLNGFDSYMATMTVENWYKRYGSEKPYRIGLRKDIDVVKVNESKPIIEIELFAIKTDNGIFWQTKQPYLIIQ